jgi:hypothetical protein
MRLGAEAERTSSPLRGMRMRRRRRNAGNLRPSTSAPPPTVRTIAERFNAPLPPFCFYCWNFWSGVAGEGREKIAGRRPFAFYLLRGLDYLLRQILSDRRRAAKNARPACAHFFFHGPWAHRSALLSLMRRCTRGSWLYATRPSHSTLTAPAWITA